MTFAKDNDKIIEMNGGIVLKENTILTVDIGNTNVTMGGFCEDELIFTARMYTERHKSTDEIAYALKNIFDLHGIKAEFFTGAIISSVVPEITDSFCQAIKMLTGKMPLLVGKEHNGNLKCKVLPIEQLGADLICGCVGAIKKYSLPCLIVDMGTATKILAVNEEGYFQGCIIAPGVKISLDALAQNTSLLPSISFTKPERVSGTNTVACMQSGIVYGSAAMLDGLLSRMTKELSFKNPTIIATGGYSKGIIPCCETKMIFDENLILDALKSIYNERKRV